MFDFIDNDLAISAAYIRSIEYIHAILFQVTLFKYDKQPDIFVADIAFKSYAISFGTSSDLFAPTGNRNRAKYKRTALVSKQTSSERCNIAQRT